MDDKQEKRAIISVKELLRKEHKVVSSEEALRDVIPPQWSEDVLTGKTKIVVGILYLCDGEIPTCGKDECYKRGRECRHTTDTAHALNQEPRNLVPDEQGNLWESSPEN